MPVLRLAIPSPLRRCFDYLPPPGTPADSLDKLQRGARVRVEFGNREVTGYLLEVCAESDVPVDSLKPALQLLDTTPLIDQQLFALGHWAAQYYHHPIGEVFSHLFPKRLREGLPVLPPGAPGWRLTTRGLGLPADPLPRSPRQAEIVRLLREQRETPASDLKERGFSSAVLRALRDKELIEPCTIEAAPAPPVVRPGLTLNEQQALALQALLADSGRFACHLLEGVTGSGKTEVYLQAIADCLARGRQALVLIPEIGLTPQTLARFEARFGDGIAVLHSGLSDGKRYAAWDAAREGRAHIVIGTRSAVFTPLRKPGLIIVDEEHDSSYKQQDGFRYSARDIAVKRAQLLDCPVLLGSATPSLESLHNAALGRYRHLRLTERAGAGDLPGISTLDVRRQPLSAGFSAPLLERIEQQLSAGNQVLLFLNRRGFAPTLQCHDCGWVAECRACDARLTVHRRNRRLRCHHCGASRPLPRQCEHCQSGQLATLGLGTEQAEQFLLEQFQAWPVHRVDSDTMSGRGAMQTLVDEINRGQPCILLGTQMLTKGHHFPGVSLVAVIDADALLFSADFRGEERMAQLLIQVAGRAGRARRGGEVILQTHYPDHPALTGIIQSGYDVVASGILDQRRAAGMPPVGQLVILRTDSSDEQVGEEFLSRLRGLCADSLPRGATMIGPLPSPMQRRAGKYRCQLLLTAPDRGASQRAADLLVAQAEQLPNQHRLKWTIDIDPQDLF